MQQYPHRYGVNASANSESAVTVNSDGLPALETTAPPEFGGPEGFWSPETLLVASVANCLILTFRAIARASRLEWNELSCDVVGVLDRVDSVTRFTRFEIRVDLDVPRGMSPDKAERILEKAESVCLVTNSLNGEKQLETQVRVSG